MNVKDKVIELNKILDELDDYYEQLPILLSATDNKRNDLMHIIELKPLNAYQRCRVVKAMKEVEIERRRIKDDMDLMRVYREQQNKLLSKDYRPFILSDIGKAEKQQKSRQYSYKGYTDEEIKELIGE